MAAVNVSPLLERQRRIAVGYDKLRLLAVRLAGQPSYWRSAAVGGGDQLLRADLPAFTDRGDVILPKVSYGRR